MSCSGCAETAKNGAAWALARAIALADSVERVAHQHIQHARAARNVTMPKSKETGGFEPFWGDSRVPDD